MGNKAPTGSPHPKRIMRIRHRRSKTARTRTEFTIRRSDNRDLIQACTSPPASPTRQLGSAFDAAGAPPSTNSANSQADLDAAADMVSLTQQMGAAGDGGDEMRDAGDADAEAFDAFNEAQRQEEEQYSPDCMPKEKCWRETELRVLDRAMEIKSTSQHQQVWREEFAKLEFEAVTVTMKNGETRKWKGINWYVTDYLTLVYKEIIAKDGWDTHYM